MSQQVKLLDIGDGVPLVFQHGLTANSGQIEKLLSKINGVRLICIDCPGHGQSMLNDSYKVSFDNYASSLLKQLDDLGIKKFIMGGLSMGSGMAINIALRCPDRVQALIVHRPAWLDKSYPDNLMVLSDAFDEIGKPGGKERFKLHPSFLKIKASLPAAAESVLGIFNPGQQTQLPDVIRKMVADHPFDNMSDLQSIACPTLVTANEDDPLHPYQMAEKIHDNIQGSQLISLTSRYVDNDLHSAELSTAINTFLKSIK